MELPYTVESLDDAPESAREFYVEDGDAFRLPVTGVESDEEVSGLKSALAKLKRDLRAAKDRVGQIDDDTLEELEQLRSEKAAREEKKAKEEGRFDELRAKLTEKHESEMVELKAQLEKRDGVIEALTVKNELRSAIADAGVDPRYYQAAEAVLRECGPKVEWNGDGLPHGVFPDEVEGDQPIAEYVKAWAKSDAASIYMPPETGAGGGATGGAGGGGKKASWEGKKYADMTTDEKMAYTEATYGGDAE